ncbi:zinc finger protein 688-like [Melanerpes formicivorus]|uniref:zinc finger protein 688-like n=1 Tax=Melanerpes formicivorus TaxID=211600 RepID=UPI00358E3B5B
MQEIYESLILLEFPVPKPNVISRLELEGELGVPDPNDSKEWETLRVAPTDEGTGSEDEEEQQQQQPEEEAAEPDGAELVELDVVLAERAEEGFPQSPFLLSAPSPTLWDPSWEELPARARRRGGGRGGRSRGGRRGRAACGQCPPGGSSSRRPPGTEKPFKCLDCGKGFTRSSNRNAHQQRTHRGQRPPALPRPAAPVPPGTETPGAAPLDRPGEEEKKKKRRKGGGGRGARSWRSSGDHPLGALGARSAAAEGPKWAEGPKRAADPKREAPNREDPGAYGSDPTSAATAAAASATALPSSSTNGATEAAPTAPTAAGPGSAVAAPGTGR